MAVLAARVLGPWNESAIRAVVLRIGEAMDVAGFHGNNGSCDVSDAGKGHQQLHSRSRSQARFEVLFKLLAMLGDLKTLMMVQHQSHSIFLRDQALVEKI